MPFETKPKTFREPTSEKQTNFTYEIKYINIYMFFRYRVKKSEQGIELGRGGK